MTCPNKAKHVWGPEGYAEFCTWAETKEKTHRQLRCPGCGLYVIWVKKVKPVRHK